MSYNIGGKLLEVTSKVVVTIDTKKFGPRQIKKLRTMIRTGVIDINRDNATAEVALYVLRSLNAPTLQLDWGFHWDNVPRGNEDFYSRLIAGVVTHKLTLKDDSGWYAEQMQDLEMLISIKAPKGHTHHPAGSLKKVFKGFSFPPNEYEIPEFIEMRVV